MRSAHRRRTRRTQARRASSRPLSRSLERKKTLTQIRGAGSTGTKPERTATPGPAGGLSRAARQYAERRRDAGRSVRRRLNFLRNCDKPTPNSRRRRCHSWKTRVGRPRGMHDAVPRIQHGIVRRRVRRSSLSARRALHQLRSVRRISRRRRDRCAHAHAHVHRRARRLRRPDTVMRRLHRFGVRLLAARRLSRRRTPDVRLHPRGSMSATWRRTTSKRRSSVSASGRPPRRRPRRRHSRPRNPGSRSWRAVPRSRRCPPTRASRLRLLPGCYPPPRRGAHRRPGV